MKKLVALVLALMLFVPAAFAAPTYEEAIPGYYKPPVMNEGQYPIKGENLKLTYWMPISSSAVTFISSYEENPAYQLIQQNTGVDIEFIHPAVGTEKETLNLLMGGELPDMIMVKYGSWYTGNLEAMYEDGIIIDLMPYLEQYAPQYKEVVESNATCQAQCYSDGKALGFYKMTYADPLPYQRMCVNKDWVLEAGLESEPQTIAELEQYFQWILDNHPDCAPFHFNPAGASSINANVLTGAFDFLYDWYVTKEDPTKVAYWANSPGYKEYVTMLKNWYDKGYLNPDFLSTTATEYKSMFDAGKLGAIIESGDATLSRIVNAGNPFTLTTCPYLTKEKGQIVGCNMSDAPVDVSGGEWVTVVTSACKQPEVAVQYLNYCYTYEGSLIPNFGVEGEAWNWGENNIPQFTELMYANPQGMTISNVSYAIKIHFGAKYCYPDDIGHVGLATNSQNMLRMQWNDLGTEDNFLQMPPIKLTAEESAERAELMTQVNTYANEMMIKFITGSEPLDNFDAYVKNVEEYGLLDAIEITQGALNRFLGK